MLKECLEVFKERLEETEGKLVLHTYIPADGTYLLVGRDGTIKANVDIIKDKKTKEVDRSHPEFLRICFYDYQSQLISMNKPVDPKKVIHSNNYFAFFVKKDSLNTGKLTEAVIDRYYEILKNPMENKYSKSKEAARIYQLFESEAGAVSVEKVERNKSWIKENIFCLENADLKRKDYLKIFFEADEQEYQREARRYLLPNIYNSNNYNIELAGTTYGMPDNNLGMNAKKPLLSIKSRKFPAPYILNSEDVVLQKQFFDYLMNFVSGGKYHIYIDTTENTIEGYRNGETPERVESGYYLRLKKGKTEAEIWDQDNIVHYRNRLVPEFYFKNILGTSFKKHPEYEKYGAYYDHSALGRLIDEVVFMNFLINNYTTDAGEIKIKDETLKKMILLSRDTIFDWISKDTDHGFYRMFRYVCLEMMKSCALKNYIERVWWQFNLLYSLKEYFSKEKGENMGEIVSELRKKVKTKVFSDGVVPIENDEEYYYCAGQLARYLLSLSKAKDNKQSLLNPILNAKTDETIKTRLMQMYKKYNYTISAGQRKFNNLLGMVEGYVPAADKGVDQEKILLGYVDNNVIYTSKEEE